MPMPDVRPSGADAGMPRGRGKAHEQRLSEILAGIAHDTARERISIGDLLSVMGDRAIGALMLIFALPNVLPTPPGTSAILGTPLVILAAQLMLGMKPWLPRFAVQRSMARADFAALVGRAGPWLAPAERLLRPRLEILVRPPAEFAVGAVCLLLATILVLPIPLGNILPALAICILSFAIIEKDGLWGILGLIVAALSVVLVAGVVYALARAAIFIITNTFN